ncbi:hypothetical protein EVAR_98297_1 [Eumeta japonica]|uniref:Uncharacterized protein n=1 Tax=Eumeta variegata TaxID=151549 RepID=A0A4C1X9B2_EUMVA|nr:hypothetical protein EVAR_98297_1 [Eumeta japonica]
MGNVVKFERESQHQNNVDRRAPPRPLPECSPAALASEVAGYASLYDSAVNIDLFVARAPAARALVLAPRAGPGASTSALVTKCSGVGISKNLRSKRPCGPPGGSRHCRSDTCNSRRLGNASSAFLSETVLLSGVRLKGNFKPSALAQCGWELQTAVVTDGKFNNYKYTYLSSDATCVQMLKNSVMD